MDYKGLVEDLKDIYENYISELCGNDKLNCADLCVGKGADCVIVQAINAIESLMEEREKLVKDGMYE